MKTAKLFYAEEAVEYGVNEAILINYLRIFICGNKAKGINEYQGRTYTYNTYAAIAEVHPFWTPQTVGRLVRSLTEKGVIVVSNLADTPFDRTSWYAFKDELSMLSEMNNQNVQSRTIRSFNTEQSSINTKESLKNPEEEGDLSFDFVYDLYDYKENKISAKRAWKKLSKQKKAAALAAIPDYVARTSKDSEGNMQLRCHFATYLNHERWTDEKPQPGRSGANSWSGNSNGQTTKRPSGVTV